MNAIALRTIAIVVASGLALGISAGCSSAPDDVVEEGPRVATTDQGVAPNATTGAIISSSSGVIGGGSSGVIVDVPPGYNSNPTPPAVCNWPCTLPYKGADHCNCPAGYGYEGSVVCPASAPVPRFVWGGWRCYTR